LSDVQPAGKTSGLHHEAGIRHRTTALFPEMNMHGISPAGKPESLIGPPAVRSDGIANRIVGSGVGIVTPAAGWLDDMPGVFWRRTVRLAGSIRQRAGMPAREAMAAGGEAFGAA
jgi:hypothetical protein